MFLLIVRLCKAVGYKLKYGRKLSFEGLPLIRKYASIKLINGKAKMGRGFTMKEGAYLAVNNGGVVEIGESVAFGRNTVVVCHDRVSIGDQCAIAPNVSIFDHDHRYDSNGLLPGFKTAPVIIEKNCWIGAGVTILRGTHIGEGCVIGAGCVVKGEISAHSLVISDRNLKIMPIESN